MIKLEVVKTEKYCYINAYLDGETERVGKLGVEYKGEKRAKIIYVITNIKHTGIGIATEMLNKAIELFKGYELKLNVVPMPLEG